MATTPTRGWHYPDENENPYWTSFVEFATDIDTDVNSLFTASAKIPYSIITTAGDLILGTGAATAARLPKGADTTILTMLAGAVGWAAPATQTPAAGSITSAMLRDSVATSVIGRATGTTGVPADIQAGTDGHVLRRVSSSSLGFGTISLTAATGSVTGTLPVANGGTGVATLTSGAYLKGAGTSAITAQATPVPVADGGTALASGTSGGVLGFTGTTTLASSALLTNNALMLGGGAAATPKSLAAGAGTQVLHTGSPPTWSAVSLTADVSGTLPIANGGSVLRYVWSQTANSSAITATTLTAFSITAPLPAGVLNVLGAVLRIKAGGTFSVPTAASMFLGVRLGAAGYFGGSSSVATYPSPGVLEWTLQGSAVVRTAGSSGVLYPETTAANVGENYLRVYARQAQFGIDLTAAHTVTVDVQWYAGSQTITMTDLLVQVLHPGP